VANTLSKKRQVQCDRNDVKTDHYFNRVV